MKISFEAFKKLRGHDFILEKKLVCEISGFTEHITKSFRISLDAEVV